MSDSEPCTKWQRKKRAVSSLLQQFGQQCKLHAEAQLEHSIAVERDKVLCDMLVHAEFICKWIEAVINPAANCSAFGTPDQPYVQLGVQLPQFPDSYVARLLRQATPRQVQQVLSMDAQTWADWMTAQFAELLVQLERWARREFDSSNSTMPTEASDPSTTANGVLLQQSAHGPSQTIAGTYPQQPWSTANGSTPAAAPTAGQADAGARGGQLQLPWQQPKNISAGHDRAALLHTLDMCVLTNLLGCLMNYTPVIQADAVLTAGSGENHDWEAVADRLQLTEMQELHLSICMAELRRLDASINANQLLEKAMQPTLQVVAAQQQQQRGSKAQQQDDGQQQSQQQPRRRRKRAGAQPDAQGGTGPSTASNFRELGTPDDESSEQLWPDLSQGLQQYAGRRYVHLLGAHFFLINTLSRYQLAVLGVASYPHCPGIFVVANIAARRVKERQQRWLQQVKRTAQTTAECPEGPGSAGCAAGGTEPGSSSGPACTAAAGTGGGAARCAVPFSQRLLQQHEQERAPSCWCTKLCAGRSLMACSMSSSSMSSSSHSRSSMGHTRSSSIRGSHSSSGSSRSRSR